MTTPQIEALEASANQRDHDAAAMLRIVDRIIRRWVDDDLSSEAAMFELRDRMAALGLPKYFGAGHNN